MTKKSVQKSVFAVPRLVINRVFFMSRGDYQIKRGFARKAAGEAQM
jgi:hypothetical protein